MCFQFDCFGLLSVAPDRIYKVKLAAISLFSRSIDGLYIRAQQEQLRRLNLRYAQGKCCCFSADWWSPLSHPVYEAAAVHRSSVPRHDHRHVEQQGEKHGDGALSHPAVPPHQGRWVFVKIDLLLFSAAHIPHVVCYSISVVECTLDILNYKCDLLVCAFNATLYLHSTICQQ